MAKKRFYGVAGVNGYGVYNDYDKVLKSKPYIISFRVKGFPYYKKAKEYAINNYKQMAYGTTDICGTYSIKRLNWFYRKNPAHEYNIQEEIYNSYGNISKARIVPFTVNV